MMSLSAKFLKLKAKNVKLLCDALHFGEKVI